MFHALFDEANELNEDLLQCLLISLKLLVLLNEGT